MALRPDLAIGLPFRPTRTACSEKTEEEPTQQSLLNRDNPYWESRLRWRVVKCKRSGRSQPSGGKGAERPCAGEVHDCRCRLRRRKMPDFGANRRQCRRAAPARIRRHSWAGPERHVMKKHSIIMNDLAVACGWLVRQAICPGGRSRCVTRANRCAIYAVSGQTLGCFTKSRRVRSDGCFRENLRSTPLSGWNRERLWPQNTAEVGLPRSGPIGKVMFSWQQSS